MHIVYRGPYKSVKLVMICMQSFINSKRIQCDFIFLKLLSNSRFGATTVCILLNDNDNNNYYDDDDGKNGL